MRLHVHSNGDGAPLVALHGLTGHGERFARLAQKLPHRVVAPDLRGHGRSTYDPPWTTEQHVQDVLDTVQEERFDLLGFSYGGRIAAALAAAVPERVQRLVLLDPAVHVAPALARAKADEAVLEEPPLASADELIAGRDDLVSTPRAFLEEEFAQHYVDGRPRVHRPMAVTAWSEMARPAPPLPDGVPVLLVTGARSWLPVDVAAIAPDDHVEVPGSHSVLWDDLDAVAGAVARFLS